MTTIVRDGDFHTLTTGNLSASHIVTGNIITGNLVVVGTLTANIAGGGSPTSDSITIDKLKHDLFIVPCYNGQKVNISPYITSVNLRATFINRSGETLHFAFDGGDTVQIWINYYDENGNTLTNGMSSAFFPQSSNINIAPVDATVGVEEPYSYDIVLNNIHYNKPEAATHWALTIRPVSVTRGTMDIGQYVIVDRFAVTPWVYIAP